MLVSGMDPCLLLLPSCSPKVRRAYKSPSMQEAQGLLAGIYLLFEHTSLLPTVLDLRTEHVCLRSTHDLFCYRAVKPSQPPFHVPGSLRFQGGPWRGLELLCEP